jgi:transcription termination/antitermination protein NusG
MRYYAIQVFTGQEDDFTRLLHPRLPDRQVYVPKRVLDIRRRGKVKRESSPVFPGYAFIESEDILKDLDAYWAARRTPGFVRFLGDNVSPTPLTDKDLNLLRHFISFGEYADTSKVTFDENDRIVVLEGPLKGLEGRIVKVNRRKGRAKVALDMCNAGFLIDFGFTAVERVKDGGGGSDEDLGT